MHKTSGTVTYRRVTPIHCYRYEIALFPVPHSAFHSFKKKQEKAYSKFSDVRMIAISRRDEKVLFVDQLTMHSTLESCLIASFSGLQKNTQKECLFHFIM